MDWSHIGSGFLILLIFFITLPFLGEVEKKTYLNVRNETLKEEIKVLELEERVTKPLTLALVRPEENEIISEAVKPVIQMEKVPKKPSWMEIRKSPVRREAVPDPRFAAPEAPLVCTINRQKKAFRQHEEKAIGCCPADDAEGTPYGPGNACCCGKIFLDNGAKFCCEDNCSILDNTKSNKKMCKSLGDDRSLMEDAETTTTKTSTTTSTTFSTTTTTTATSTTTTFVPTTTSLVTTTELQKSSCQKPWDKRPQKMDMECSADRKEGSTCQFSCPLPLRLNGTEASTCIDGTWSNPPPSCCMRFGCSKEFKLDLFLIIDASSSIGTDNFSLVRRFVKDLADFFEIGQDRVRIGLISFNRKVTMMINLNEIGTKAGLDEAVDSIPYNGKGTNTGKALQEVVDKAFKERNGDRADVENQVVVITDGKSKDDIKTPGRALKKIAHVMAIGVGVKVRAKDLFELATSDEYVYTPESYSELGKLKFEVADKYCPPGCV